MAWTDRRGGNYDIYAQRVDSMGVTQWATDGVALTTAAGNQFNLSIGTDGAGGAIVAWTDQSIAFGDDNIRAQRIDASGTPLWAANGILVCGVAGNQQQSKVLSDGAGGAYVAWNDFRTGSSSSNSDIFAQRIDATGALQWAATGVPVCVLPEEQGAPILVPSPAGGVLACWIDNRNGEFNHDLYAQAIDPTGTVQWATNGVPVCTAPNHQFIFGAQADGAGGFIAVWTDYRVGGYADIYVQRVDNTGTPLWTSNGVPLCTAPYDQNTPALSPDGAGGMIVAWGDLRDAGPGDIYAQRVNSAGVPQWSADGVPVCVAAGPQYFFAKVVSDGAGGAVIAWPDGRGAFYDIYAQRIDGTGARKWALNGLPVCSAASSQFAFSMVSDGGGGAILAWDDFRSGSSADIYAQRIEVTGSLSGPLPPTGSIAGRVTASCPAAGTPIAGVIVDAFAVGSGDLLGTDITDANGDYSIPDIQTGDYTVTLVTPLGYSTATSEQPVTVPPADTAIADFNLACVAASGDPRNSGFWKHQFGVATGGNGSAPIDGATLCTYLDMIELHFNNNALNQVVVYSPPGGSTCAQKLDLAKGLLNLGGSAAPVDKARQQLLSLLLNVAANYLTLHDVISKDGATASQAVTYCDQLIDNPSGDYSAAASIADKINSGQKVNAGVIPLGTQNISYAMGGRLLEFAAGRNPASGPRTFLFALSAPAKVDLSIYDVQGRRVAQVYAGQLGQGRHALPWDGTGTRGERLGRGVYFSRLSAGDQTRVAKLVQTTP